MHGIQWQEVTPSDYAMAWARDRSSEDHSHQPIFYVFPDTATWSSGDTFTPHPTKPHHWRFSGREDDNFWMSDVQMVNPRPFEQRVREDPGVISATMFGENRPSCCLVVELRDGVDIEVVWPSIEKASQGMRSSEQVHRSMVIAVNKEKLVPKTMKGDVKRRDLAEAYSDEIEACYNQKA